MKHSYVFVAVFLWTALGPLSVASAALTPEQQKPAEVLITQFTAPEFAARQAAVEKLIALGPDVLPLVKKTLAETTDAEVKLRCGMVLKGIAEKFGVTAGGPAADVAANIDGAKLTLDVKDVPLSEVLDTLARESGNRLLVLPENFQDRPVTLSVKEMPYWQALDRLCASAGLVCVATMDEQQSFALVEARNKAEEVVAYAGPAAVRVGRCERTAVHVRTRRFRADVQGGDAAPEAQNSLSFQMTCHLEDRRPVFGSRVRFTQVLTGDGQNHLPAQDAGETAFVINEMGQGAFATSFPLEIQDTEAGIQGPVTIAGTLEAEYAVGRKELKLDDVFGRGEPTAAGDGITVTLKKAERNGGAVTLVVEVTGEARTPLTLMSGAEGMKYGFFLVDPAGNGRWNAQTFDWEENDAAVPVDFPVKLVPGTRLDGKLTVTLENVPQLDGRWSFVIAYPLKVEAKQYPFTIKDVPLP